MPLVEDGLSHPGSGVGRYPDVEFESGGVGATALACPTAEGQRLRDPHRQILSPRELSLLGFGEDQGSHSPQGSEETRLFAV